MKRIIILLFCLGSLTAFSQKAFEGTITYRVSGGGLSNANEAVVELAFGPKAIRARYIENGRPNAEVILYRFDSLALFKMNDSLKNYESRPFARYDSIKSGSRIIAGMPTHALTLQVKDDYSPLGQASAIHLQLADDLYYYLPKGVSFNGSLFFIRDNKIALGLQAYDDQASLISKDSFSLVPKPTISAEAISVTAATLAPAVFEIPPGFERLSSNSYPTSDDYPTVVDTSMYAYPDSLEVVADSVKSAPIAPIAPKEPAKLKPPVPIKKKPAASKKKKTVLNSSSAASNSTAYASHFPTPPSIACASGLYSIPFRRHHPISRDLEG